MKFRNILRKEGENSDGMRHNIGFINKVKPLGRGSCKLLGIPKNKECSICNITKE